MAAGILGFLMLALILFSSFYIAAESDHDCCGEDCPVCSCIQICEDNLRLFENGVEAKTEMSAVLPVLLLLLAFAPLVSTLPQETLVSRKVRMNN